MAHHPVTSAEIAIHGDQLNQSSLARVKTISGAIAAGGMLISLLAFFGALGPWFQGTYSYSWLFAFYFYFTISIGGVFWTLLHNVSNSGWGTSVRRIFENVGATYPFIFLLGLPLLLPQVQHVLYEWMTIHREAPGNVRDHLHHVNHMLYSKYGFMNYPFWLIRFFFYGIAMSLTIHGLRKLSIDQDTDPKPGISRMVRARFHSTYTLILFALTITFSSYDLLLSIDYKWYSTMWGVYIFSGSALSSMSVIILIAAWLKSRGHLKNVTGPEHFHIMGKLLLTFTIFWAYIAFSQFFLIWYANITEETSYFIVRNTGNWNTAMITLVFAHFVVPFVILLQAWLKRNPKMLSIMAVYTLAMHVLDHYLIAIPERGVSLGNINPAVFGGIQTSIPGAFWGDILAFVTIGAGFVFFLIRAFGQHSVYPNRDPRILESANVSN